MQILIRQTARLSILYRSVTSLMVALVLLATGRTGNARGIVANIEWNKPLPPAVSLTRSIGDTDTWTFSVNLIGEIELVGKPSWGFAAGGNGGDPGWGLVTQSPDLMLTTWMTPTKPNFFRIHLTVSVQRKPKGGVGQGGAAEAPEIQTFDTKWTTDAFGGDYKPVNGNIGAFSPTDADVPQGLWVPRYLKPGDTSIKVAPGDHIAFSGGWDDLYDFKKYADSDTYEAYEPDRNTYTTTLTASSGTWNGPNGPTVLPLPNGPSRITSQFLYVPKTGANFPITVSAKCEDTVVIPKGSTGSAADAAVTENWSFTQASWFPKSMTTTGGTPEGVWTNAPTTNTYLGHPGDPRGEDNNPPVGMVAPFFGGQSVYELFDPVIAGFPWSAVKGSWKEDHPTIVSADQFADLQFTTASAQTGLFPIDPTDHWTDNHNFNLNPSDMVAFTDQALAAGVYWTLPQTFSCGTTQDGAPNNIGKYNIDVKYTNGAALQIRKGPR